MSMCLNLALVTTLRPFSVHVEDVGVSGEQWMEHHTTHALDRPSRKSEAKVVTVLQKGGALPNGSYGSYPPVGVTNHGEVEALELLCARCETLAIFK